MFAGTFTYRLKGFERQPTDHYTRTFFQFAEKFEKDWKCSGPIPQHKVTTLLELYKMLFI
jgi:hypothetical protein